VGGKSFFILPLKWNNTDPTISSISKEQSLQTGVFCGRGGAGGFDRQDLALLMDDPDQGFSIGVKIIPPKNMLYTEVKKS
jgi:hypothetical protein